MKKSTSINQSALFAKYQKFQNKEDLRIFTKENLQNSHVKERTREIKDTGHGSHRFLRTSHELH